MSNVYVKKTPSVEGIQFDGTNGDAVVEFVGGADYGVVSGDTVVLTPAGKDPRGGKVTVVRGQFVVKSNIATSVVNEGEMITNFTNLDGSLIEAITPEPVGDPVADEELVYQPGFGPLTEEDKKKAEDKAAADKKKAAADEKKAKADEKKSEHIEKTPEHAEKKW